MSFAFVLVACLDSGTMGVISDRRQDLEVKLKLRSVALNFALLINIPSGVNNLSASLDGKKNKPSDRLHLNE